MWARTVKRASTGCHVVVPDGVFVVDKVTGRGPRRGRRRRGAAAGGRRPGADRRALVRGRSPAALPDRVEAFEAWLCKDALERTRYKQKEAAALLGLSYDQFRQRYRKYGLGKD